MGRQACILYGAAEFSRNTDLALQASSDNLQLLRDALLHLKARRIVLPPFQPDFLQRGHAIHFRSYHPDAHRIRIDVMSVMRGVDDFEALWRRRTTFVLPTGESICLLSLPDLVRSKKTQPMAKEEHEHALEEALEHEQKVERQADRHYWEPLVRELEELTRAGGDLEEEV